MRLCWIRYNDYNNDHNNDPQVVARQSVLSLKAAMRKMTLDEDEIEEVLARAGLQPEEPQYGACLGLESVLSPPRSERLESVCARPRSGLIGSGLAATCMQRSFLTFPMFVPSLSW
eukprot:COSAG06_NODE_2440_length_6872_cov_135.458586_10_plen_116_part_00